MSGGSTSIHPLGVVTQYHPRPMASGPTPSGWINVISPSWSGDNLKYSTILAQCTQNQTNCFLFTQLNQLKVKTFVQSFVNVDFVQYFQTNLFIQNQLFDMLIFRKSFHTSIWNCVFCVTHGTFNHLSLLYSYQTRKCPPLLQKLQDMENKAHIM